MHNQPSGKLISQLENINKAYKELVDLLNELDPSYQRDQAIAKLAKVSELYHRAIELGDKKNDQKAS